MSNGKKYELYDDIILKYEFLISKKIDDKKVAFILEENANLDAYYRALNYLKFKMRTDKEIKQYLKKASFNETEIAFAIEKLNKEGYLNSNKYAEAYIDDAINLTMNGPHKIYLNLKNLGIDENVIDKYLSKISSEEWSRRIERIVEKKSRINKQSAPIFKKKMASYLIGLGYDSESIKSHLVDLTIDTDQAFRHTAEKMWNQLARKYEGKELNLRFKNKMLVKGFTYDQISKFVNDKFDENYS